MPEPGYMLSDTDVRLCGGANNVSVLVAWLHDGMRRPPCRAAPVPGGAGAGADPAMERHGHGHPRFSWKAMPCPSREGANHRHPEFGQILVHVALLGNQTLAQFTTRYVPQLSRTLIVLHRSTEACCRQASLALKSDMQMGTGGFWIGTHWH